MRVLVAMMKHETNTFSPVPTDLARFAAWGLHYGDDVLAAYRGTNMPIAAYIALAEAEGAEIVSPIAAEAMPSGTVQRDAFEHLADAILAPIREGGIDACFLDLHGAMTAEHEPDGEGALLARIRAIAPDMPIAVTCDLHANLTPAMVENCTALIGYKTYPHVDMAAVGEQVGRILWKALKGEANPVMTYATPPLLAQTLCMGTDDEPMKGLIAATRDEEAGGIMAATVFGGFPMADVAHAGLSVVTVADGDLPAAEAARDRLAAAAWGQRAAFIYQHRDIAQAIEGARGSNEAPVVLLDHSDNVGSGGTADVMGVIEKAVKAGLDNLAVAAVWDPEAVEAMFAAGLGATLTLPLGGKTDMPGIGRYGEPWWVTGRVSVLSDGKWTVKGPMYTGVKVDTGPTAVLDVVSGEGLARIVVTSHHHEPWDAGIFTSVGIDPAKCRYLLLKSRIHYRAGFAPFEKATFTLDGTGVTTSDNSAVSYTNIRRPIYPLDEDVNWP